ncbi:MAG: squalene synthase HpnC [Bacteroidota bacterium]
MTFQQGNNLTARTWPPEEAFRYCERLTRSHYENFPVASLFLPGDKRKHVAAIYAFARTADDFADEPGMSPGERLERLTGWEHQLERCYEGQAHHPVFVALRETAAAFDIPIILFRRLLAAFRSDVTVRRYATLSDLLAYSANSANPVGRLVLLLFGYRSDPMMLLSDKICTALQLTNFWQDVTVDLDKDRVYLPVEDLGRFGVTEEDLTQRIPTPGFQRLLAHQIESTRGMFLEGQPILNEVGRDLRFQLQLTWRGGMRILQKIENVGYDVFRRRPVLSPVDKIVLIGSSIMG